MVEEQGKHYSGDVASGKDVQRRMNQQFRKFQELSRNNTLTPEWRRFGKKHAEKISQLAGTELLGEDKKARITPRPLNKIIRNKS